MLIEFLEKALAIGGDSIEIEYKNRKEWVTAFWDCVGLGIGCLDSDEAKPAPRQNTAEKQESLPPETPAATVADDGPGAIYFDFDSAVLREDARDTLAKVATDLKEKDDNAKIAIEGNCDALGTVEYNLALGARRAKSAYDYLRALGIPKEQMSTQTYGEEVPADPGHNEAAWAKNRRVESVVK